MMEIITDGPFAEFLRRQRVVLKYDGVGMNLDFFWMIYWVAHLNS